MAKKTVKKSKPASRQVKTKSKVEADNVNVPAPTALEQLRNEFLELNGGCVETALLAACQQLQNYAAEIEKLERSSIAGFNRSFNQNLLDTR